MCRFVSAFSNLLIILWWGSLHSHHSIRQFPTSSFSFSLFFVREGYLWIFLTFVINLSKDHISIYVCLKDNEINAHTYLRLNQYNRMIMFISLRKPPFVPLWLHPTHPPLEKNIFVNIPLVCFIIWLYMHNWLNYISSGYT